LLRFGHEALEQASTNVKSRRRIWVALGIGAAAIVLLLVELAVRAPLPDVTVVPVTRQTLDSWVSTNGTVEPEHPYILQSRLDTFVTNVAVVPGQNVKRGQLLLQLDSAADVAQLAQARQQLLMADQQLQDARAGGPPDQVAELTSELTKAQASRDALASQQKALMQLVAEHAATQDELAQNQLKLAQADADVRFYEQKKQALSRQAQFNANQAELSVKQAQASIADLSEKVASAQVVAPVDGTVYALTAQKGTYVQVGAPLAEMADLREVRVVAYVDEMDLGSLAKDQLVQVQWDAIPGRVWTGQTELIPKQVVAYKDRSVGQVLCSATNSDLRLLPNTHVDVRIRVQQRAGSLVVPREAVQGFGSSKYVYVYRDGALHKQPIQVGIDSTSRFEVLSGLAQGDLVAMPGATRLMDGLQVHPVQAPR
jgi:HlyD family secretion protein